MHILRLGLLFTWKLSWVPGRVLSCKAWLRTQASVNVWFFYALMNCAPLQAEPCAEDRHEACVFPRTHAGTAKFSKNALGDDALQARNLADAVPVRWTTSQFKLVKRKEKRFFFLSLSLSLFYSAICHSRREYMWRWNGTIRWRGARAMVPYVYGRTS